MLMSAGKKAHRQYFHLNCARKGWQESKQLDAALAAVQFELIIPLALLPRSQ